MVQMITCTLLTLKTSSLLYCNQQFKYQLLLLQQMNQSNDQKQKQSRKNSEEVIGNLKQKRERIFYEDQQSQFPLRKTRHFQNLQQIISQANSPNVSQIIYKYNSRSSSVNAKKIEDKQLNYKSRIKNIDFLQQKIKGLLGKSQATPIKQKYDSKDVMDYKFKHNAQNILPKTDSKNYQKYIEQISQNRQSLFQSTKHIQVEDKKEIKMAIKKQGLFQNTKIKQEQKDKTDIEQKLRELRLNRMKIKKQLGLQQKHISGQILKKNNNQRQQIKKIKQKQTGERDNYGFIKRIESIEIKKEQSNNQQDQKSQIIKLAQLLGEQIREDKELTQYRSIFTFIKKQSKWVQLQQYLTNRNIIRSIQDLKLQLTMSSQEHNPFGEPQISDSDNQCITKLGQLYQRCMKCWQKKIVKSVSIEKLERQLFTIKDIDLNKKGYLSIEDIVCFVNLYSGNFFRNRDIILTYRRFLNYKKQNLSYENFLSVIISD